MAPSFHGIFVALTTPYQKGSRDKIDETALARHVDWLVRQGVQGVVPCGTTGEAIALSGAEKARIISICVEGCQGKAKVIAGVGMPTTDQTIEAAQQAEALGVDGLLVVTPYFVKACQEGLMHHYQKLHEKTNRQLLLYSNPSRTGVEIGLETIYRLAEFPRIIGLKDASYDLARPLALRQALGKDFTLLSGEDKTFTAFLAQGGDGLISVSGGIAPHLLVSLWQAWQKKDLETCLAFRDKFFTLNQVLFSATSPGPVKYAAHLLGFGSAETRLPLSPVAADHQKRIAGILNDLGIHV